MPIIMHKLQTINTLALKPDSPNPSWPQANIVAHDAQMLDSLSARQSRTDLDGALHDAQRETHVVFGVPVVFLIAAAEDGAAALGVCEKEWMEVVRGGREGGRGGGGRKDGVENVPAARCMM